MLLLDGEARFDHVPHDLLRFLWRRRVVHCELLFLLLLLLQLLLRQDQCLLVVDDGSIVVPLWFSVAFYVLVHKP